MPFLPSTGIVIKIGVVCGLFIPHSLSKRKKKGQSVCFVLSILKIYYFTSFTNSAPSTNAFKFPNVTSAIAVKASSVKNA